MHLVPFPRVLMLCEMQSVSFRIWTSVAVSISYDENYYTTITSMVWCLYGDIELYLGRLLLKLHVRSVSLSMYLSVCFAVQKPINLWRQNSVIIFTFRYNPNLFQSGKHIPNQLWFKSSSRVISFTSKNSHSPTQNNISIIIVPYLVVTSCQF